MWPEDTNFNVKLCNMKFPSGKPKVEVKYLISNNEALTSGAVEYSMDLPAKATALTLAAVQYGPVTKGFPMSMQWTLSSLGKVFTKDSLITATFPKYYNAELGPGLKCLVGPDATAEGQLDTYCNVAKGDDFRLEIFG